MIANLKRIQTSANIYGDLVFYWVSGFQLVAVKTFCKRPLFRQIPEDHRCDEDIEKYIHEETDERRNNEHDFRDDRQLHPDRLCRHSDDKTPVEHQNVENNKFHGSDTGMLLAAAADLIAAYCVGFMTDLDCASRINA